MLQSQLASNNYIIPDISSSGIVLQLCNNLLKTALHYQLVRQI